MLGAVWCYLSLLQNAPSGHQQHGHNSVCIEPTPSTSRPPAVIPVTMMTSQLGYQFWEQRAGDYLYRYLELAILVVGTVGNVISFIVFNRKSMCHSVGSFYFRVLSVSDTMALLSMTSLNWFIGTFHIDVLSISTLACKLFPPLFNVSCYMSCWILVFIAIDRSIAVYLPHKYRMYSTKPRAAFIMITWFVCILATVGVYNAIAHDVLPGPSTFNKAMEFETELGNTNSTATCSILPEFIAFHEYSYLWLDLVVLNLIPTVILVSLNLSIIKELRTKLNSRFTAMKCTSDANSRAAPDRKAALILVSVSIVYILCTIPSSTRFLVVQLFGKGAHAAAQSELYNRCCRILWSLNHGANFFIYSLHGEKFRSQLKSVIGMASESSTTSTKSSDAASSQSLIKKDHPSKGLVWATMKGISQDSEQSQRAAGVTL